MIYNKPALSVKDQVGILKKRNLLFKNETVAELFLLNNNFYRLRGYTYPFQENNLPDQPFICPIYFEDILEIYYFDRELRLLIFKAIEKIEIALRTQIVYQYSVTNSDSHWFYESKYFSDPMFHSKFLSQLKNDICSSPEKFISHYQNKYHFPDMPPCWSCFEIVSFGTLSLVFKYLHMNQSKQKIMVHFDFNSKDDDILKGWIHNLSIIRNICAHYGRLWDRELPIAVKFPQNSPRLFIKNTAVNPKKLYASICCIQYLLNSINQGNEFKIEFQELLRKYPSINTKKMGFPKRWAHENFWKI
ncbi:Abi family protein [Methanolapillus millepedarum]